VNECELIRKIAGHFPRSREQLNGLFGCDAELIEIGGRTWGMTLDEFTPEEDRFTSEDPERLGWNLAVATLSDLLAAGVAPRFFLNALALPSNVEAGFADALCRGIAGALSEVGAAHCGGDLGTAAGWRFTGFAMGPLAAAQPLTHRGPVAPQTLYVTGAFGDANLAALTGSPTPRFELRTAAARIIRQYATVCIDTSGGFFNAVWVLHEQNPAWRIEIACDAVPLADGVRAYTSTAGIPAETALLGGAGEYELLWAAPADLPREARLALTGAGATAVGATAPGQGGVCLRQADRIRRMESPPPCPREAASTQEHVAAVIRMAQELCGR